MNPADNLATYYTVNDETASNGYFKTYGYNSKFKDAGPDSWDQTRLRELNLQSASGSYWYARRNIDTFKNTKFRVEYIISNGTPGYTQNICYIDSSGRMNEEERRTLHSTCFPSYTNS